LFLSLKTNKKKPPEKPFVFSELVQLIFHYKTKNSKSKNSHFLGFSICRIKMKNEKTICFFGFQLETNNWITVRFFVFKIGFSGPFSFQFMNKTSKTRLFFRFSFFHL